MSREEFIRQLEYLLQDIPEEDREDAISYYRDYLEEAGDEGEEQALREFGSPERVAAIIRSDLNGILEDGGEFTEAGYQDERFRDPRYAVVKRKDLPDVSDSSGAEDGMGGAGSPAGGRTGRSDAGRGGFGTGAHQKDRMDRLWLKRLIKVGLLLLVLGVVAPVLLGIGGSVLGIMAGIAVLVVAAVVCVGVLTVAACVGAVALLVFGIGMLFAHPWAGVLVLGGGMLVLGLAFLGIALSVLVYGTWIPWGIRTIVNGISNLIHRERRPGR